MDELTRIDFHNQIGLAALLFFAENEDLDHFNAEQIVDEIKKISTDDLSPLLAMLNDRKIEDRLEFSDAQLLRSIIKEELQT